MAVFFTKNLGAFEIDVTIEETHNGNLAITRHPVEKGTEISDHAQVMPKKFDIVAGVSDFYKGWSPGKIKGAYETLVKVQESREPFSILTGLTQLKNMLIRNFSVTQDDQTAHVLLVRASCEEVVIVGTKTMSASSLRAVTADGSAPSLEDNSTQNRGAPTVERGDVQNQESKYPLEGDSGGDTASGEVSKGKKTTDRTLRDVVDIGWGSGRSQKIGVSP